MVRCEVSVGKIEIKIEIDVVYTCSVYLLCSKKDN
jgi:hypothetical protein